MKRWHEPREGEMLQFAIGALFLCAALVPILTIIDSFIVAYQVAYKLGQQAKELDFGNSENTRAPPKSSPDMSAGQMLLCTPMHSAAGHPIFAARSLPDLRRPLMSDLNMRDDRRREYLRAHESGLPF